MVTEINSSGKSKDKLLKIKRKKLKKVKQERLVRRLEKEQVLAKTNAELEATIEDCKEKVNPISISIAIPGSIFDNAQSLQLKTYLVGQIARAAAIYKVTEIIIFNESPSLDQNGNVEDEKLYGRGCMEMAHLLQYLECPQYLRKSLFPHHPDLQYVGLLNPLDSPHHLRVDEWCDYREAVVVNKPAPTTKSPNSCSSSYVNAGLYRDVKIDRSIQPGTRLTIKFDRSYCTEFSQAPPAQPNNAFAKKKLKARVVSPQEPYLSSDLYWGYNVRLAQDFSSVFTKCPYKNDSGDQGYDLKIGTSDKGENIFQSSMFGKDFLSSNNAERPFINHKHCLIVFGGLRGLEYSFEMDDPLFNRYNHVSELFDYYLNVCPHQGSRTIRTEEALLIALSLITPNITQIDDKKSKTTIGNDNKNVNSRE